MNQKPPRSHRVHEFMRVFVWQIWTFDHKQNSNLVQKVTTHLISSNTQPAACWQIPPLHCVSVKRESLEQTAYSRTCCSVCTFPAEYLGPYSCKHKRLYSMKTCEQCGCRDEMVCYPREKSLNNYRRDWIHLNPNNLQVKCCSCISVVAAKSTLEVTEGWWTGL